MRRKRRYLHETKTQTHKRRRARTCGTRDYRPPVHPQQKQHEDDERVDAPHARRTFAFRLFALYHICVLMYMRLGFNAKFLQTKLGLGLGSLFRRPRVQIQKNS